MTTTNKTESKAIKAAALAISAEKLGNDEEAEAAGRTAGRYFRQAGWTINQMANGMDSWAGAELTWNSMVDGWYEVA